MTYVRITPINRPIKPLFDRNYEYTQADRDAYSRYQADRKTRRDEFLKSWVPPSPAPTDPDADGFFEAHHVEDAAFDCWELQRAGKVVAATTPHWINHVEALWLVSLDDDNTGILEREPTAASVTLPFLMPGGEFSVTYESEKEQNDFDGPIKIGTRIQSNKRLRVQSEHGIHFGQMKHACGEMSYELVILPHGTPQEVADRVAAAYSKIVGLDMPTDYPAVMPLREACTLCGRPFTDQVSKVIGIGPRCSQRMNLPHSVETANHILQRRRELAGE